METNKSINRSDTQKNLYNALVESYNSDKYIITSYGDTVLLKRGRDDQDKDKDPSAGSDRWTKRRKSGKDAASSKDSRRRIIIVTRLIIIKKYDYGHMEEIEVRQDDQQLYRSNLKNKTAYTSHSDPHGIIYVDSFRRKRLMRTYELHKFSDGMLNDVRSSRHCCENKDGIFANEEMEQLRQEKGSGYGLGNR
nr:hypothetical protein [Tanacetum cinerariifolium]